MTEGLAHISSVVARVISALKKRSNKMSKNGPDKTLRAGGISATIWSNARVVDGDVKVFKSVSISRSYKDKNGQWQDTNSFGVNDLGKLRLVIDEAYRYLFFGDEAEETPF